MTERSEARLPDRVQAAIARREALSEILIGWVQFAVLATFAILYAVTPPAADNDRTMLQPVPLALAGYFAFTVLRLILAHLRATPSWLLYLSIVVDTALLLGLIWSFHIQYHQPASFYLKAPTVLYLFIFIALRALRFDARYVIVAGLVAAAGWALMVGYAVEASDQPITRDYVAYMTGNRILLGAEMDKIISILMVTGILALALIRARALLVAAVREGLAAEELSRFFDPAAARAITRADRQIAAGDGVLRNAAVLMVDIRGFSALADRLAGDAIMAILGDYHRRVVPIVRSHGGAVDKFLGDGVMATFVGRADDPAPVADGLRALDAVIAQLADWR
ncbi:MAG: adenylate/guanylate cyclase domain-containing protein, partial [Rhodospirillaceae bacterium]|nr:adenylate/guanylate cyclase domain-containing protein [Rhodospirillaceae bacterium]